MKAKDKAFKSMAQLKLEEKHKRQIARQLKLNKKHRREAMQFEDYNYLDLFR